jgi:hypothetical protein
MTMEGSIANKKKKKRKAATRTKRVSIFRNKIIEAARKLERGHF